MASANYQAKIPGSVMLCGEHAVLHGSMAIACAVAKYITITLTPQDNKTITINSELLGSHQTTISTLEIVSPWQFVLTTIKQYQNKLPQGFTLDIQSDFSDQVGLGSSAAVTVATIVVLEEWLNNKTPENLELFKLAKKVVLEVQGVGSGTDIAASVYNGCVAYKVEPLYIEKLAHMPPLTLLYSGSKTPTVEVIKKVAKLQQQTPETFAHIYAAINSCTEAAISAIQNKDWVKLGQLMNIHQGLQDAIGTNNKILSELIFALRQHPYIYGAKISGSGLGDCVIGLGAITDNSFPQQISLV